MQMTIQDFQNAIKQGIPNELPEPKPYDNSVSHAPKREHLLSDSEKKLALKNALRYFDAKHHAVLAPEFAKELEVYGRIYMHRFRPDYKMYARPIECYPAKSQQAAAIMLMIQNNLDYVIAQHPHELITYGGNGSVFQNWGQYLLTMQYLSEMNDEQTLAMYSGHPMGLFPSHKNAPRVIVTNGMMIPNHSSQEDWNKFNALGVTQYGQMTAGSFMYIGPQGIVHGTTITVLNAARMLGDGKAKGKVFVTSGLGGMSGAQAKAAVIAGMIGVVAEINPIAARKRHTQGWVDEIYSDLDELIARIKTAKSGGEAVSMAFEGNIVELWEALVEANVPIDLGSDQTSLHNPYSGGYYPAGLSFEEGEKMIAEDPEKFRQGIHDTLCRHVNAINTMTERGMYFFDYGNAFLKSARDLAKADILKPDGSFKYPSYVEDIMGPMCFDFGFGPFRWVCASGKSEDLDKTDAIAARIIEEMLAVAPTEIQQQLADNLHWIKTAKENKLVVGSQARILYADAEGRMRIAEAFNNAIAAGEIGAIVLGRDHHDVSGTDSPYRETSNIKDGSMFTADMAIQNVIGDAFRGATWVSIHNGGGVGWGEVMNGGFGMLLDGSPEADARLKSMLHWDVNNGISRRAWARNEGAIFAIKQAMKREPNLKVTLPNIVNDDLIDNL
jgi:urocanate hydratase